MSDVDIGAVVADALQKAIEVQSRRIMEQVHQMMPTLRGDFSSFFVDSGDDLDESVVDSTAIVIDDSVKALPSPMKAR